MDKKIILRWIIFLLFPLWALGGCHSSRHTTSSSHSEEINQLQQKDDSIHRLIEENKTLSSQIHELQYSTVVFDSSKCPPPVINIPPNCNADSLLVIIGNLSNHVKILADGSIEASGQLRSVTLTKKKLQQLLLDEKKKNDSLSQIKQTVLQNVSIADQNKKVDMQTKVLPGFFWWLIIAALAVGIFLGTKFNKQITSIFSKIISIIGKL